VYAGMLLICIAQLGCMQGVFNTPFPTEEQCEAELEKAAGEITGRMLQEGVQTIVRYKCDTIGKPVEGLPAALPTFTPSAIQTSHTPV
jgi:hypothetical protein